MGQEEGWGLQCEQWLGQPPGEAEREQGPEGRRKQETTVTPGGRGLSAAGTASPTMDNAGVAGNAKRAAVLGPWMMCHRDEPVAVAWLESHSASQLIHVHV